MRYRCQACDAVDELCTPAMESMSSAPHLRPAAQLEYGLRVVLDGAERTRPKIDAELKARIAFDALLAIQKRVCHLEIYPEDALIQEPLQRRFHFISGLPRSGSTLLSAIFEPEPPVSCQYERPVGGHVRYHAERAERSQRIFCLHQQ